MWFSLKTSLAILTRHKSDEQTDTETGLYHMVKSIFGRTTPKMKPQFSCAQLHITRHDC